MTGNAEKFAKQWLTVYDCGIEFPELPFKKMYVNKDLVLPLKLAFSKLKENNLLHEIKSFGGCWNVRYIRGYEKQGILSIHSWGMAVDFNVSDNPLGMTYDDAIKAGLKPFSKEFQQVWRECGWVAGIDFKRGDGMHFEYTKDLETNTNQ